jgi:hypothetical protein
MEEPPSKKIKVNEDSLTNLMIVEILPREILCIIFSYLDKKSVQSATATCKLWFALIRNDSNLSSHVCFKAIKLKEFDKRIQDLEISMARWPVLKTIKFCGHYPYFSVVKKLVQHTPKLVNSEDCPPLEKIIVSVSYCLERFFPHLPDFGTIEEFTFNPNNDIRSLQVEHISSLGLELKDIEDIEEVSSGLKLIGATACNLKQIIIRSLTFYKQKEVIERFRNSICQMLKQLSDSLQIVELKVNDLNNVYIDTIIPNFKELTDLKVIKIRLEDLKNLNLTKLCEQCKKLKNFHVDVTLCSLSSSDDDWIENEFSEHVEKTFQDITEVKIQFYLKKKYPSQLLDTITITKKPYQSTTVISKWY